MDDLKLPEIINDNKAQGASADAHSDLSQRTAFPRLINTVDMQLMFSSNKSCVQISDQGVVNSETTIISSIDQLVLTAMAQNVQMKNPKKMKENF